jgi:hypothetical protein
MDIKCRGSELLPESWAVRLGVNTSVQFTANLFPVFQILPFRMKMLSTVSSSPSNFLLLFTASDSIPLGPLAYVFIHMPGNLFLSPRCDTSCPWYTAVSDFCPATQDLCLGQCILSQAPDRSIVRQIICHRPPPPAPPAPAMGFRALEVSKL